MKITKNPLYVCNHRGAMFIKKIPTGTRSDKNRSKGCLTVGKT